MFNLLRNWRRRRLLERSRMTETSWWKTVARLPLLAGLNPAELARLRELTMQFLDEKSLEPAGGLSLTAEMGPMIAVQASLLILNLGFDYYRDWRSVILYPEGFMAQHEFTDEIGLVHRGYRPLIGEAWQRGPIILSWADIAQNRDELGLNVVIHEMAHKLDMLSGAANGLPPLHRDMAVSDWSQTFTAAYDQLCRALDRGQPTALDPYAADSPAEFFAVSSETFFRRPGPDRRRLPGGLPATAGVLPARPAGPAG